MASINFIYIKGQLYDVYLIMAIYFNMRFSIWNLFLW